MSNLNRPEAICPLTGASDYDGRSSCHRQDWNSMTDAEKKLALRQVIKRIDVYSDKVVADLFGIKKEITPKLDSGATFVF
ncbi:hypothetical protein [Desulfoscipio sp. XC116]|uniref:hypothetical protein n=1 Tax=Desulfoscipio sp. XC116 TaxID=3144975 RepID=UPI00325BE892